jgi:hypothetical protein
MYHQRNNIQKILILIHFIYNHDRRNIGPIYICNKTSIKWNILTIQQNNINYNNIIPILIYIIPTVTNNKEINIPNTIIVSEITTTTTVIYNQIIGTMTTLLVLYMLITVIVVVNIINVPKGPLRHINKWINPYDTNTHYLKSFKWLCWSYSSL